MVAFTPNYQIAVGHNNAAGLTAVNLLTDTNSVRLVFPKALAYHEEGELVFGANAASSYQGFDSQDWVFSALLLTQYTMLRNTYTGLVTVKTCLDGITFANYNASAWIAPKPTGQPVYFQGGVYASGFTGPGLLGIALHLIKLEAL